MSIAVSLMDQVLETAKSNNLNKIDEIEIEAGFLRQIVGEVMQEAFLAVRRETIAENAILRIIEIAPLVKCNICKKEFEPEINDFLCPQCQKADVEVLKGDEIILKSIAGN
ncbi:MAG: hydrogenase maturation nickel metallochaperone HypA [Candidatus Omnitrophica bacterium]|nr:hydrogenase maturation nickel metallochaperone HypA [Candidatus Omnitrophota bacterium]